MDDPRKIWKMFSFYGASMNYSRGIYLPAFATSQGSLIVSPATNLNVSDRDMKLGSALLICGVTGNENEKDRPINNFASDQNFINIPNRSIFH